MDIFVHLPRTGGTSISNTLLMQYGIWATYRCDQIAPSVYKTRRHIDVSKPCVVMGHIPYGNHAQFGVASAQYFTMLREPCARLVSHYNYVKSNPKHYLHEQVVSKKLTFESYVLGNISSELSNGMVRQLSGHPAAWASNPDFDELYEMALNNLDKFVAIGFVEDYFLSLMLFHNLLQWPRPSLVLRENQSQDKLVMSSEEIKNVVSVCNDKDILLYQNMRKRFVNEIANIKIETDQSNAKFGCIYECRKWLYINTNRILERL